MNFTSISDYLLSLGFQISDDRFHKGNIVIPASDLSGRDISWFQLRAKQERWDGPLTKRAISEDFWEILTLNIPSLKQFSLAKRIQMGVSDKYVLFHIEYVRDTLIESVFHASDIFYLSDSNGNVLPPPIFTSLLQQIIPEWHSLPIDSIDTYLIELGVRKIAKAYVFLTVEKSLFNLAFAHSNGTCLEPKDIIAKVFPMCKNLPFIGIEWNLQLNKVEASMEMDINTETAGINPLPWKLSSPL